MFYDYGDVKDCIECWKRSSPFQSALRIWKGSNTQMYEYYVFTLLISENDSFEGPLLQILIFSNKKIYEY